MNTKYVFISGGVLSGLGKGVCSASLGVLLKSRGYKVAPIKCENYLNIDSGTINPIEHGDPFLCDDGLEADMDLGTYERFLGMNMGRENFTTMGQIYQTVIQKERNMEYDGEDVEAIPHVSDEIVRRIKIAGKGQEIVLVELGGTAGEYQNMLYYEACRIMKATMIGDVVNIHVSYVPVPKHIGEPKTMPTQMSVRTLMEMGIQPEFLILRSEVEMDKRRRYILGLKTSVMGENVVIAKDIENIYELPIKFLEQSFDKKILKSLGLPIRPIDISPWRKLLSRINSKKRKKVRIAVAGKYFAKNDGDFELIDSYHALYEAIHHAAWKLKIDVAILPVNTVTLQGEECKKLEDADGIIVPIGWGKRGTEGKISAIRFAREKKIPFLGLCYGMQLACVEFARNVAKLKNANSAEVDPDTKYPIIYDIPFDAKYQTLKGKNTSMRLGAYDCYISKGTYSYEIYQRNKQGKVSDGNKLLVSERHRHRYEFNNKFKDILQKAGLVISGTSKDDFFVEMVELPKEKHPFFIGTQGHPEYKSTPLNPHPLFVEFLKTAS
ncbi:MAG: CTP synthase [Candidatus Dojkabacteria bacterium]|nr:CTP synthase [Candidatus Dojkabacteria bacterium]